MRLLLDHPFIDRVIPVSKSAAGEAIHERDPGLSNQYPNWLFAEQWKFLSREDALGAKPDVVFSALPPGESANFCEPFFKKSVIIDLSADFRLEDPKIHESVYGRKAPLPLLRSQAVYGLVEIYREQLTKTDIVAVPGCYPTCVLLPLIPLIRRNLITGPITVSAMSGISGAGRMPRESSMYVERAESTRAYNPGLGHRHVSEMRQELIARGYQAPLYFAPHLVPMRRGMAATTTVLLKDKTSIEEEIALAFQTQYGDAPFIQLRHDTIPDTRDVVGSNRCDIGWHIADGRLLYLFSVIDNLLKGAAGQAVQAFNIRFGFPDIAGLPLRSEV